MASDPSTADREILSRYLLGQLPAAEEDRVEDRFAADDGYFALYQEVENSLIHGYVTGTLEAIDTGFFETNYLVTAERRRRVLVARALVAAEANPHRFAPRFGQFRMLSVAAAALVAVAVVTIGGHAWRAGSSSSHRAAAVAMAPTSPPTPAVGRPPAREDQSPALPDRQVAIVRPAPAEQVTTIPRPAAGPPGPSNPIAVSGPPIVAEVPRPENPLNPSLRTRLTDDRAQVITAGAVVILKVDGLVLVPISAAVDTSGNTYKLGGRKIIRSTVGSNPVAKTVGGVLSRIPLGQNPPVAGNVDTRRFLAGEKLNVTKVTINADRSVSFELASYEAYGDANTHYRGTLTFNKGAAAMTDGQGVGAAVGSGNVALPMTDGQILRAVREVFSVAPPETPATQIPDPPAPSQIPPPAAPRKLSKDMTIDQVKALYGEPASIIDLGTKVIYRYTDIKVTFVDGKVSDVE